MRQVRVGHKIGADLEIISDGQESRVSVIPVFTQRAVDVLGMSESTCDQRAG
jgi:hypothetical protein